MSLVSFPIWGLSEFDLVKREGLYYKKFSSVPFTGEFDGVWDYFYVKGFIKNGRKEGSWESYHDNGQLYYIGTYKDGKREGPWSFYYENGRLNYRDNYKNGKRNGFSETFWDNGQLRREGYLKNNEWEGFWKSYYKDGSVWEDETGTYKNGVKVSD